MQLIIIMHSFVLAPSQIYHKCQVIIKSINKKQSVRTIHKAVVIMFGLCPNMLI